MFTGIIEEVGRVIEARRRADSMTLTIAAHAILGDIGAGDSVCIDGVCQTVTACSNIGFTFDAQMETIRKTTLGTFVPGRFVNLERSLTIEKPLGGHFVQGHVNGTGRIAGIGKKGSNVYATVSIPGDLILYCVREGSIALDGISFTISELSGNLVTINVIPYTFHQTTIQYKRVGDMVNIETDLLGRYVGRFLEFQRIAMSGTENTLTEETLRQWGW